MNRKSISLKYLTSLLAGLILTIPCAFAQIGFGANTTGGAGGSTVTVTNASQFLDYISRSGSYIIRVDGTINISGMNDVASNKTIVGVGSNGHISGGGLDMSGVNNVIIQNLTFTGSSDDAINIQDGSTNIWVDHCTFGPVSDGQLDIKRESDFITVSWNHFYDHDHTCLLGHSDNHTEDIGHLRVTYHHNFFDGTEGRNPRIRYSALAHVFNNYYRNNNYGIASTQDANALVEGNYFENVDDPCLVGYASSSDGNLVERNNIYSGSGSPETRGSVPNPPYGYSLDNAANIPGIVMNGAGAGNGGGNGGGGNNGGGNGGGPSCGTCSSGISDGGVYRITPRHAQSKSLELYNFNSSNGANVNQWEYWGGDFQHWVAEDRGGGYWSFHPVPATGRAMDVWEMSTANGANIAIYDYWGGDGQQWYFTNAGSGGWVRIISRLSGKCLDVENASGSDGANVLQYDCISNSQHQMFRFQSVSGNKMVGDELAGENGYFDISQNYPNPFRGHTNFNLWMKERGKATVTLYNAVGKRIDIIADRIFEEGRHELTYQNKDLDPGLYIFSVKTDYGVKSRQMLVR